MTMIGLVRIEDWARAPGPGIVVPRHPGPFFRVLGDHVRIVRHHIAQPHVIAGSHAGQLPPDVADEHLNDALRPQGLVTTDAVVEGGIGHGA